MSDEMLLEFIEEKTLNISREDADIEWMTNALYGREGMHPHVDQKGILTSPGGMTLANINKASTQHGLPQWVPDMSRKDLGYPHDNKATSILMRDDLIKRRDGLIKAIPGFRNLEPTVRRALLDVSYNANISNSSKSFPNLKRDLNIYMKSQDDKDLAIAMRNILDVVKISDKKNAGFSKGLAKRRASSYNNVARAVGFPPITRIKGNSDGSIGYHFDGSHRAEMNIPAPVNKRFHKDYGYFANQTRTDQSKEWVLGMGAS